MLRTTYFFVSRARWFPSASVQFFVFVIVVISMATVFYTRLTEIERCPKAVVRLIGNETTPWTCERTKFVWNGIPPPVSDRVYVCKWPCVESRCKCFDPAKVKLERGPNPPWAIQDASELRPNANSIFFFETGCKRSRAVNITFWEACGVESAALLHPNRTVYLLVVKQSAISADVSSWSVAARALLAYPNVRFARVSMARYMRGTPLGPLFDAGALSRSLWPSEHASAFLRFLTLWRFGGVTLDLDFIVTNPLDGLGNFAVPRDSKGISSGVIGLTCDDLGRNVSADCLKELHETFHCSLRTFNDDGVITRVVRRLCKTNYLSEMTQEVCSGLHVLPRETFFPFEKEDIQDFFNEGSQLELLLDLDKTYAINMWFARSQDKELAVNVQQPYAQLARRFCPRVVAAAVKTFGT